MAELPCSQGEGVRGAFSDQVFTQTAGMARGGSPLWATWTGALSVVCQRRHVNCAECTPTVLLPGAPTAPPTCYGASGSAVSPLGHAALSVCFHGLLWWGWGLRSPADLVSRECFCDSGRRADFRVFAEGVAAESMVLLSEGTEPSAFSPGSESLEHKDSLRGAGASGAPLPPASCPCLPLLASQSSGWFHEQSWPLAPESQAGALQMSQFLAEGKLHWALLFPFCSAQGGGG